MPTKLNLPDSEIAKLRDSEGLTFVEIKDRLGLDCHEDTISRHYKKFKKKNDTVVDEIVEGIQEVTEEVEEATEEISEKFEESLDDYLARLEEEQEEAKEEFKGWWQRFKDWLFSWQGNK